MRALSPLRSVCALLALVACSAFVRAAAADQERAADDADNGSLEASRDLRAHFSLDIAARLLASQDPADRARAVERALHTAKPEEAAAFLTALTEPSSSVRSDGAAMMEVVRALSTLGSQERVARALGVVMTQALPKDGSDEAQADNAENKARLELARDMAALALARTREQRSYDGLYTAARGNGPGQLAATRALITYPPERLPPGFNATGLAPVLERWSDLRLTELLQPSLGVHSESEFSVLSTLARLGDTRVLPAAREALTAKDPRVRAAATEALVLLRDKGAPKALLDLLEDESTTLKALALSPLVRTDDVVMQVAARAVRAPNAEVRKAALLALTRTRSPLAVRALFTLTQTAEFRFEACHAMGRSPEPSALVAVEQLLAQSAKSEDERTLRRHGARAYLTRAVLHGDRSARAEEALRSLAESKDDVDRQLASQVRVALNLVPLEDGLASRDVSVRTGAILGAVTLGPAAQPALLARLRNEPNAELRIMLLRAMQSDPKGPLPVTLAFLGDCAEAGSLLCARVYAERGDEPVRSRVRTLLHSRNARMRAVVAAGLGAAAHVEDEGTLAFEYRRETRTLVRRALIAALAKQPSLSTNTKSLLRVVQAVDPDEEVRAIAERATLGMPANRGAQREVAWLRVEGPPASRSGLTGELLVAGADVVPVLFDGDGIAVVAGVPTGDSELVLSTKVP